MPELPEVETYARYFARHALHQRIRKVDVRDERILGEIRRDTFARKLKGRAFESVRRHGKHLFADAGTTWLHLHFGMTGDLLYGSDVARFARIVFEFDGGSRLSFEDMRLFGLADLVSDPDAFIRDRNLGPDPLSLTATRFGALFENRRGAIKSLLMTQEVIAGLGNLYVDEILFQTSVHPRRAVDRVRAEERRALYSAMRRILREAIARHARESELPRNYLFHNREEGTRCPRCGGTIQRAVVFGRTTYFCAKHQK
ncbi:MAG TPA: DNA-formamidopyrimidine glycosylase family protein [Thermoanaerobaculia bacterium]|jgi:formamidopyrimidine-DNA glycosylase|nr:DNA-formamidopyrimidine glycosylase family protein [Thermoanaerobaculia bacterium]